MNYKLFHTGFIAILLSLLFFAGCEKGYRSYLYVVRNESKTDTFQLTYSLRDGSKLQQKLEPEDTLHLCKRKDVLGGDIWNIETSSTMYAIPSIVAAKNDSSRISKELSQRIFWPVQPEEKNGMGVYELRIDSSLLVLEKIENYHYFIHSKMDDTTLFVVTSTLSGETIRQRDTIRGTNTGVELIVDIYSYGEKEKGTDEYNEKKLSGISSLSITYNGITKSVDLKKPYLYNWQIERKKSTLNLDSAFIQSVF